MPFSRAVQTLLLLLDPRETPLGELSGAGLGRGAHTAYGHAESLLAARTGFNGRPREAHGWYHLGNGHRVYNPVLMRFHSPDRLSPFEKGGLNAYAYCLGDPVNFTDPSGRFVTEIPGFIVDNLFDTPIASMVHNTALLVGALFLNVVAPPAGAAMVASAAAILGSGMGIAGGIMQFAGEKEAGSRLATVGTTISAVASVTRVFLAWDKLKELGKANLKDLWKGTKNAFSGGAKKPAMSAAKPAVADGLSHEKMFEAAQIARRGSAPGMLGTQTAASFKQASTVSDVARQVRKNSMFSAQMGAPGIFQNMPKKRLSAIYIRD